MPYSIEEVNGWSVAEFKEQFKNVVECWPEAAVFASALLPFRNVQNIILAFRLYLEQLPVDKKVKILQLHPELGEAKLNTLTAESQNEQQSAGLDQFAEFDISAFNQQKTSYKSKFGFPFVICVRENTRDSIIRALNRRLENTPEEELTNGINEVKKICHIRIQDIVN